MEHDDPTLDEVDVQRFSEMICQAIDARLTFGVDVNPAFGGSKVYGPARGRKECMPKAIIVEEAVHVGTQYSAGCAHGAVWNGAGHSLAYDVRKRTSSRFIKSFTDVDFVAFKAIFRR